MSPEIKKQLTVFFKRKTVIGSIIVLGSLLFSSLMAEWVTNSKPAIAMINGKIIIPAYIDYNRPDMGLEGAGVVDYREIKDSLEWAIWPVFNWDPYENDLELEMLMSPPDKRHILGTDVSGRDVFARLLYGTRVSFMFALCVWIASYILGSIFGLIQGYSGSLIDLLGQRFVEVFSSIPTFYLLIMLIALIQPNVYWLILISTVFGWVSISQYMRAEALKNRKQVYAEAAISLGAKWHRVLFRHILPNSLIPLITFSPFAIVGHIYGLASLDFLGFGVPPPTPSWGELLDQAQRNFQVAWWLALFPSIFLFTTIVTLNLIGEALRVAFDPRAN